MGTPASEFDTGKPKTSAKAGAGKHSEPAKPAHAELVNGLMESLQGSTEKGTGKVEPGDEKDGLVGQLEQIPQLIVKVMQVGVARGIRAIKPPKVEQHELLGEWLSFAASAVIAGLTGSLAVWVAQGIAIKVVQKFVVWCSPSRG